MEQINHNRPDSNFDNITTDKNDSINNDLSDEDENDNQLENELKEQCDTNIYVNNLEVEEKDEEEGLKLSKEDIIQFKNYQIRKLKAYISSGEKEKEDLINDYKEATNSLLDKIKQLEFEQNGFRPETPMIANKLRMNNKKENGVTKADFKSITLNSDIFGINSNKENKQRCPNCGIEINEDMFLAHSLQCLRKKYKCQKCNGGMDDSEKEGHNKAIINVNNILQCITSNDEKRGILSLEHGFKINDVIINNNNGDGGIHIGARINHLNWGNNITGYNLDRTNKEGQTPLFIAIESKNTSSAKWGILKGCNINNKNKGDMSPGMGCCKSNLIDGAELLIKKGAKVNEKNILGDTPLKIAQINGNEELAILLMKTYKASI